MSYRIDKAAFTAHMYDRILACVQERDQVDGERLLLCLAGLLTETLLLFDDPDEGLVETVSRLAFELRCKPAGRSQAVSAEACLLVPPYILDKETELGRSLARELFEEWLECAYEFHDLLLFVVQHVITRMGEEQGNRMTVFDLFTTFLTRCLSYEIAAQELCDVVIEEKIGKEGWNLGESISGLSAVAGRLLGLSRNSCQIFEFPDLPDSLDQVAYVMTQEAIRLGIPAGSDWRFGLAANDYPVSAPFDLIFSLMPVCQDFLLILGLEDEMDQAVACAKAAGRMLAVAAGGETPAIEPVVAKPLALLAMTDTYKEICMNVEAVEL